MIYKQIDMVHALFIDIGTNGEIVLSNHGRLLCSSCAAGPALEGMNISSGMRAAEGAIEDVEITADPGSDVYQKHQLHIAKWYLQGGKIKIAKMKGGENIPAFSIEHYRPKIRAASISACIFSRGVCGGIWQPEVRTKPLGESLP